MPPEFDPAWEYYCGNPEIEEMTTRKCGLNLNYEQVDSFRRGRISVFKKTRKDRVLPRESVCPYCNNPFVPRWRGAGKMTVYCSRECWYRHREAAVDLRLAAIPKGRCGWCGGEVPKYKRSDRVRKFCSWKCVTYFHVRAKLKRRKNKKTRCEIGSGNRG